MPTKVKVVVVMPRKAETKRNNPLPILQIFGVLVGARSAWLGFHFYNVVIWI